MLIFIVHSRSKCLVRVKKCCHIWLDQNFDPSLLTNKLWLVFMGKKQKRKKNFEKKNSKWPTQKKCIFLNRQFSKFFVKISWHGSKFWSSQMWQHFLTHAKHFEGECTTYILYLIWSSKALLLSSLKRNIPI